MSNLVFPTLPGLSWDRAVRPIWNTRVQQAASGKELRSTNMAYPIRAYSMSYEVLRAASAYAELQTLVGFFNKHRGSFDSWLFDDPDDNAVTAQNFGTGNGTSRSFQLVRTLGGTDEAVSELKAGFQIFINGSLTTLYSISAKGVVTFNTAPANAAVLTWTGGYYWRCRFAEDEVEFNQFLKKLWEAKQVDFRTVKP